MDSQLDMFAERKAEAALSVTPTRSRRRFPSSVGLSDEDMGRKLEEGGQYRVLRRLQPRQVASVRRAEFPHVGIILDTETTGLNHRSDEIIEIGAIAFTFKDLGLIGDVIGVYGGLQQPSVPIPPEIIKLTGITNAMVANQMIDMKAASRKALTGRYSNVSILLTRIRQG